MGTSDLLRYYGDSVQHPVLQNHIELLGRLVEDRVCGIFYSEHSGFAIQECCDDWFSHSLTKEECLELSDMFSEIALHIE